MRFCIASGMTRLALHLHDDSAGVQLDDGVHGVAGMFSEGRMGFYQIPGGFCYFLPCFRSLNRLCICNQNWD